MKTKLLAAILISIVFSATAQEKGKYIFTKSGHIEFNLSGSTEGTKSVWYDDYGIKMSTLTESTSTVSIMGITQTTEVNELEIRDGNMLWKINLLDKTGTKTTIDYAVTTGKALTDKKTDAELHEMERQAVLDLNGTIEGYENILGKKCLVFTLGTTKFWQYKGYPLKSNISMLGLTNNETAISFEENITVPASKFAVPAGVSIKEGVNPMDGGLGGLMNQLEGYTGDEGQQQQENEYEEPLHANLSYDDFVKAVNNIKITGFKRTASEESTGSYMTLFRLNDKFGGISIMNTELYDRAEEGENIEMQKTYTANGKAAKYAFTREGDTGMHVVFIKYPVRKMTLMIHSERSIPLSTLEEIALQLNF
jgi:hypothetical protein